MVDSDDALCYKLARDNDAVRYRHGYIVKQPGRGQSDMHQVVLGLGTNLGRRWHNLEQAVTKLSGVVSITAVSPVYESEPWGPVPQPAFLNACLLGQTKLTPHNLLTAIKLIEEKLGRAPTVKWGPRLIDIDMLLYEDVVLQTDRLTIPHPFMQERAFVLIPLADIAPDLVHPELGQTMAEMAKAVDASTLKRLPQALSLPAGEPLS